MNYNVSNNHCLSAIKLLAYFVNNHHKLFSMATFITRYLVTLRIFTVICHNKLREYERLVTSCIFVPKSMLMCRAGFKQHVFIV